MLQLPKRKTWRAALLLAAGMFPFAAAAEGLKDIRINEVLVINETSYADDHANHSSWIELYNTGYSYVDVGGAFLSIDPADRSRTYRIPKNDARTLIAPQGYVIFFANGESNRGTLHTNFTLDQTGRLYLLDQGRTPLDSLEYDLAAQQPDVSIGWIYDPDTRESKFGVLPGITPMQTNNLEEAVLPHEKFRQRDPSGIVMAITAMSVVFVALVLLYLIFKMLGKVMVRATLRKEKKAIAAAPVAEKPLMKPDDIIGEEIAAIAIALRRYDDDMHDIETHVLTINRIAKAYSPWSSKIYGLTNRLSKK